MSDYIETLLGRVEGAMASDRLEGHTDNEYLKAVLWEIRAESWEDGVMWKGGIGTIKPERPPNPFLKGIRGEEGPELTDVPQGRVIPSRSTDPATSHAAARTITVKAGTQRARLLEAFAIIEQYRTTWDGATDEEAMEQAVGVSPRSEFAKRCSELREAGLIEATGETRTGASGHQRIVSRITEAGQKVVQSL